MTTPIHCDSCRWCPLEYPGKGLSGDGVHAGPDYDWRSKCGLGHRVMVTWTWDGPNKDVKTIHVFRAPTWTECTDREEPYTGLRVSRYEREPVI
jgi:hypothetical protein